MTERASVLVCSDSVKTNALDESLRSAQDNADVLPQGLSIVRGLVSAKFSVRVLARLAEAEQKTECATEQQDIRIAWLTVLRADEGNPDPWKQAFWEIVGNTPEKAIPFWLCRDDLLQDEYVPLSMLELRYTREWGSDYVRAKMAAEAARNAGLPPKKPVEFATIPFPAGAERRKRVRRGEQGFSSWLPIAFTVFVIVLAMLWIAGRRKHTYFYQYPGNYLRVVQNLDPCEADGNCGKRFVMQSVVDGKPNPETEMRFSEPQHFEAGHTFAWFRYLDKGSVQIQDGFDVLKDPVTRMPILPANCIPNWATNHIECEGGKARF